ncbi:hypothetical protein ColTof4_14413 [Colletotrichum tofieldiae]|nr:hypothetical protein ColTof3_14867 [Colletotrichum tofieldiae]GKT81990.1 hypothetical protein ColTof4_14413 [Colletotrichum tofieldiae]
MLPAPPQQLEICLHDDWVVTRNVIALHLSGTTPRWSKTEAAKPEVEPVRAAPPGNAVRFTTPSQHVGFCYVLVLYDVVDGGPSHSSCSPVPSRNRRCAEVSAERPPASSQLDHRGDGDDERAYNVRDLDQDDNTDQQRQHQHQQHKRRRLVSHLRLGGARLDGALDDSGPLYDFRGPFDASTTRPQPSATSPDPPPCTFNSAGQYVPEPPFIRDVVNIIDQLFWDLQTVNEHGPPNFTLAVVQSRDSSAGGNSSPAGDGDALGSVRGSDLPLDLLHQEVSDALDLVDDLQAAVCASLPHGWPFAGPPRLRTAMRSLLHLRRAQTRQSSSCSGSDCPRLAWIRQKVHAGGDRIRDGGGVPLTTAVSTKTATMSSLSSPPTQNPAASARRERLRKDTGSVPGWYVSAWQSHMASRESSSPSAFHNDAVSQPPSTTYAPRWTQRHCLLSMQESNETASALQALLLSVLALTTATTDPHDENARLDQLPPDVLVFRYASSLPTLLALTQRLSSLVSQVTRQLADHSLPPAELPLHDRTQFTIARIHRVAPFLHEIVTPRLAHMSAHAHGAVGVLRRAGETSEAISTALRHPWAQKPRPAPTAT